MSLGGKQVFSNLISVCFISPGLGHKLKTNCMEQIINSDMCSILVFKNGSWFSLSITFWTGFFFIPCHRLITLLLEISSNMSIRIICCLTLIFSYLIKPYWKKERTRKLLRWNKKSFHHFLREFQLPEIVSELRVCL